MLPKAAGAAPLARASAATRIGVLPRDRGKRGDSSAPTLSETLAKVNGEPAFTLLDVPIRGREHPPFHSRAGVARAFADLPAACGPAFAEAVTAIERFLAPFECWSMLEYGLYGDDDEGEAKLSQIDDEPKAAALLRLLDATIGSVERAIVPFDLGNALEQVRRVAPRLAESQSYRRLATLTRR